MNVIRPRLETLPAGIQQRLAAAAALVTAPEPVAVVSDRLER